MKVSTNATPKSDNAHGPWLRQKFGGRRVFKVIVDAGFTCPNRAGSKGYGGCTYCNVDLAVQTHIDREFKRRGIIQGSHPAK